MATKPLLDRDSAVYYSKYYRQALATAPACAVSVLAGSPLENIKTRMQSRYFSSALACTQYTYRTEGVRGFFAGTVAPLLSITLSRTFSFSIYRQAKYKIDGVIESSTGVSPLQHVNKNGTFPNLSTVVCFTGAGMIAGGAMATVLTPFELIKTCTQTSVLMASNTSGASGAVKNAGRVSSQDAVRQIIRDRGILGLYTGFRLHFLRDTLGSGIYFGVYEAVKQSLNSAYGANQVNAPGSVAFAGAVCGIVAWGVTYPLDSMKTQTQNRLVGQAAKDAVTSAAKSAAKSASFSKWKGIEMAILRSAFQNMIQMSIFEQAKLMIDGMEFSNGSRTLPEIERELGRDQKIRKNPKL